MLGPEILSLPVGTVPTVRDIFPYGMSLCSYTCPCRKGQAFGPKNILLARPFSLASLPCSLLPPPPLAQFNTVPFRVPPPRRYPVPRRPAGQASADTAMPAAASNSTGGAAAEPPAQAAAGPGEGKPDPAGGSTGSCCCGSRQHRRVHQAPS